MFDFFWNVLFFIIALGVLITFHELGHFWVARRCGVKVLRFSIGFGKPLLSWTGQTGTEYVIAAIPLGGYVKMLDERVDDVAAHEQHLSFNHKTVWQRIVIVAAGPLANLLLAVVAFWLMFMVGVQTIRPIITGSQADSIAAQAGMNDSLEIVEIDGRETPDWETVSLALVAHIGTNRVQIKAKQPDSSYVEQFELDLNQWQFDPEKESPVTSLGLMPYRPDVLLIVSNVEPNSSAHRAGFLVGDTIVQVNQKAAPQWQAITQLIQASPSTAISFTVLRNGQQVELTAIPDERRIRGESRGFLGIAPTPQQWPEHYVYELSYGVFDAVEKAGERTWQLISLSVSMIGKLITGDVSVKNLSGPISIAQGAGASASFGFVYFLGFVALISVNIGILNLLPLPVLDGGHLVYYFVELITVKAVPEKVQEIGFRIGSVALMALMGLALFNDFSRL